jgi:arginase
VSVIGVPSGAGARRNGHELGPASLRGAGLVEALRVRGFDVHDAGDLPAAAFFPDPQNPRRQNLDRVIKVARNVAAAVAREFGNGRFPLLLGGDCTITIGALSGLSRRSPDPGLVYIDGDLDLNTPETSPSGIFDGMVAAHLVGGGAQELARIGPAYPLVDERRLVLFGFNTAAGGVDPPELEALRRSAALRYPVETVRLDPGAAAREAMAILEQRAQRFLLHFDVDVTDTLAVDVTHPGGLSLAATVDALRVFAAHPACAGLVVTEFNPALDADGTEAQRYAAAIADALGGART